MFYVFHYKKTLPKLALFMHEVYLRLDPMLQYKLSESF